MSRATSTPSSSCSEGCPFCVGAIGIANVTLVSVLERVGEIGLRRALGAARRHVAGQFLMESTAMGLVGGIIGASLGVLVVVAISAARTWTPVLDPAVPLARPLDRGRHRSRRRSLSGASRCRPWSLWRRSGQADRFHWLAKNGDSVVVG